MRPFWDAFPDVAQHLAEVRDAIRAQAESDDGEVRSSIRHLLDASGKMLRPAFVIIASGFGQPDREKITKIGAAVEMLHMATLAHDDIIDAAFVRRGAPTLFAARGPRTAVLVGDWLFAACISQIADFAAPENAGALSRIVSRICAGEVSQSAERHLLHTSVRRYLRRIAGKTAALFALSFYVGARESGCAPELCNRLRRIGYCLGMGFQIIDDVLDFDQAGRETGKPTGTDLSEGIYTLPTILALQSDDGALARALGRRPRSRRALSRAAALIDERGGITGARAFAARFTERSRRETCRLPGVEARRVLEAVTEMLLHRTY